MDLDNRMYTKLLKLIDIKQNVTAKNNYYKLIAIDILNSKFNKNWYYKKMPLEPAKEAINNLEIEIIKLWMEFQEIT